MTGVADTSERLSSATADEAVDISTTDYNSAKGWSRGLYVGVAGHVQVILENGASRLYKNMAAGVIHPLSVKTIVKATTTATDMVLVR